MLNEIMLNEILDQPQAVRESLPALRLQIAGLEPHLLRAPRLVLTGSGDSFFAPLALKSAALAELASDVHAIPALQAARYWRFRPSDLVVPISVSGEAVRTLEAVQSARRAGARTLAITGNGASSLARVSRASLIVPFHSRSRQTPHTTDFMTTLVALAALVESSGPHHLDVLDSLAAKLQTALDQLLEPCRAYARSVASQERFYILGGGPDDATAQYGAAKFWEAGGLLALAFDSEEFAHGPHLTLDPGDVVLIVAAGSPGVSRALELVEGLRHLRAQVAVITDEPDAFHGLTTFPVPSVPPEWSPFYTTLPLQLICWAVATEKGYDVIRKDGRIRNPEDYEKAHWSWVRGGLPFAQREIK